MIANRNTVFFTICSNNYLSFAKILLSSARLFHPGVDFFICLADEPIEFDGLYPAEAKFILAKDLGIPDFDSFAFQYDIMEFNTAVKPFVFLNLFQKGYDSVVYFDPDMEVFRPLTSVLSALAEGAPFVLTPHLCSPAENDREPDDITIMRAGTYNLGFLACSRQPVTEQILAWWARRLRFQCINKQEAGIFVDQKFMDLVPGFADRTCILRDTTVNIAYWNLAQHPLERDGETWLINGQPLSLFHFSGVVPGDPTILSKYTNLFRGDQQSPALRNLLESYCSKLDQNGHGSVPPGLYAYGKFASGTPIHSLVRRMYRERHLPWFGNPFETYEEFIHQPYAASSHDSSAFMVTNFMQYLWSQFPWTSQTFNLQRNNDVESFVRWYAEHAIPQLRLDPRMIEPVTVRGGRRRFGLSRAVPEDKDAARPDVTIVGYLKTASGVGEVGRQTLRTMTQTGYSVGGYDVALGVVSARNDTSCDGVLSSNVSGRVQIFNINADQLPLVIEDIKPCARTDAYRIVVPFWELAEFPSAWYSNFDNVDEIWAPTRFIQAALFRKIAKPIVHMPVALSFEKLTQLDRDYFSLPKDKFLFFFAFDFLSFQERKNPRGTIRAFRQAFKKHLAADDVLLVIKSINGAYVSDDMVALRDELAHDPHAIFIDKTFTRSEMLNLIGLCDCILSLHRSEGLGLLVAEAMMLEKPVIATDYSATTEFVTPATGFPVEYRLIPVENGQYPFAAGEWADPDLDHAAWLMRQVYANDTMVRQKVESAKRHIENNHSIMRVAALQSDRLKEIGLM